MTDFLLPPGAVLRSEIEVKRSRFLATVARANGAECAREHINAERALTPDARHHCTAFAVSVPGALPILHSSDDGEPSGTAGRPMLDVLTGVPLIDVVSIVTRYFGGTLLGTGGLVRAYSDAVHACLEGTELFRRVEVARWRTLLPHAEAGRFIADFSARGWSLTPTYIDAGVDLAISSDDDVAGIIASLSSGAVSAIREGATFVEISYGKIVQGNPVED